MFSYGSLLWSAFIFDAEGIQNHVELNQEEFTKKFEDDPHRLDFFNILSYMKFEAERHNVDLVSMEVVDISIPFSQRAKQGLYVYFQGNLYHFPIGNTTILQYSRGSTMFVNLRDKDSDDYDKIERQLVEAIGFERFSLSHYNYLDIVFKEFSEELLGEDLSSFTVAHGDKSRQYKTYWEQHGVPFFHGAAIHLLSYTKLMDREKHLTKEFVVDKYPEFKPLLDKLDEKYKLTKAIR